MNHRTIRGREALQKGIVFKPGLAAALPGSRPTLEEHLRDSIEPRIKSGQLGDGTRGFDDRKVRYDRVFEPDSGPLEVYVAITDYFDYQKDSGITKGDVEILNRAGLRDHKDPFAYFSRPMGVTVIPVTSEGSIVVGRRANSNFHQRINGAAGYIDFKMPQELSPEEDAYRELKEEFGVLTENVDFELLGISTLMATGETDIVYLAKTPLPNSHFLSDAWLKNLDSINQAPEHIEPLVIISSLRQVRNLLYNNKLPYSHESIPGVMYGTFTGLQELRKSDLAA